MTRPLSEVEIWAVKGLLVCEYFARTFLGIDICFYYAVQYDGQRSNKNQ